MILMPTKRAIKRKFRNALSQAFDEFDQKILDTIADEIETCQ